jgi:septum formation protein
MKKIILASNSPRRRELMKYLNVEFESISTDIEEIIDPKLTHDEMVMDLAFQKALSAFNENKEAIVLGFDTLVVLDEIILGKPKDKEEAKQFLNLLSDNTHLVYTGCAVLTNGFSTSFYSKALVKFAKLTDEEIEEYVETEEPMDKAGAYGIQGYGAKFVEYINGDYYAIMGFPIAKIYKALKSLK